MKKRILIFALLFFLNKNFAQNEVKIEETKSLIKIEKTLKKWYESISIRGYAQFRYNRLLETNSKLGCEQCDRSWGNNGGFFLDEVE